MLCLMFNDWLVGYWIPCEDEIMKVPSSLVELIMPFYFLRSGKRISYSNAQGMFLIAQRYAEIKADVEQDRVKNEVKTEVKPQANLNVGVNVPADVKSEHKVSIDDASLKRVVDMLKETMISTQLSIDKAVPTGSFEHPVKGKIKAQIGLTEDRSVRNVSSNFNILNRFIIRNYDINKLVGFVLTNFSSYANRVSISLRAFGIMYG